MFQSLTSQAMLSRLDVLLHLIFLLLDEFTPGSGETSTSLKGRMKQRQTPWQEFDFWNQVECQGALSQIGSFICRVSSWLELFCPYAIWDLWTDMIRKKPFMDLEMPLIFQVQISFLTNAIEENLIDSHLVIWACLLPWNNITFVDVFISVYILFSLTYVCFHLWKSCLWDSYLVFNEL